VAGCKRDYIGGKIECYSEKIRLQKPKKWGQLPRKNQDFSGCIRESKAVSSSNEKEKRKMENIRRTYIYGSQDGKKGPAGLFRRSDGAEGGKGKL